MLKKAQEMELSYRTKIIEVFLFNILVRERKGVLNEPRQLILSQIQRCSSPIAVLQRLKAALNFDRKVKRAQLSENANLVIKQKNYKSISAV